MEEVTGAAGAQGEEKSGREQRGQAGVWGRLISASSSKKNSETPPKPTPDTLNATQGEMGRQPRPQCFLFKTSENIPAL